MQRCLELAKLGLGATAPNPMVGCVIVKDERIIGEGHTSPYGGNHAEVNAILSVEDKAELGEATLYVSLEPCCHHGKTPPCTDLIISSGIPKVVIGTLDPFAAVNGQGVKKLEEAGIRVENGVLEVECRWLNRRFISFHEKNRPYVILKWAETSNGFVDATRKTDVQKPLRITDSIASTLVHKWRTEEQAILVGKNTALLDNPNLTSRKFDGKNPVRVLLDANLEMAQSSNLYNSEAKTIILNTQKNGTDSNIEFIKLDNPHNVNQVLDTLAEQNIQSVLVEGGPTVHRAFYQSGNWDEIRRFVSNQPMENGIPAMGVTETASSKEIVGNCQLLTYLNA